MKRVVVVIEGAADSEQAALGGRTPLQVARSATASRLAREGRSGWLPIPDRPEKDRSESFLAQLCGATAPEAQQMHRGPLEVCAMELDTGAFTHAYRGNFVTLEGLQVRDPLVRGLSFEETKVLTAAVQERFDPQQLRLVPVSPATVVALVQGGAEPLASGLHPILADGDLDHYLPQGRKGEWVRKTLDESARALGTLTLNDVRLDLGENPATHLWLWGGGPFCRPGRRSGAIVSNSRMALGLGRLLGMGHEILRNPWSEDAADAIANIELMTALVDAHPLVVVYVAAPMEPGLYGAPADKVRLLERLDLNLLAPLVGVLETRAPARLVLTADNHLTAPGATYAARVPVAVWRHGVSLAGAAHWDEESCRKGAMGRLTAEELYEAVMGEV